jgi:hypothetical protein
VRKRRKIGNGGNGGDGTAGGGDGRWRGDSAVVMGSDGWRWNGGWVTFGYVGDERRRRKTIRRRGKWGREREK